MSHHYLLKKEKHFPKWAPIKSAILGHICLTQWKIILMNYLGMIMDCFSWNKVSNLTRLFSINIARVVCLTLYFIIYTQSFSYHLQNGLTISTSKTTQINLSWKTCKVAAERFDNRCRPLMELSQISSLTKKLSYWIHMIKLGFGNC